MLQKLFRKRINQIHEKHKDKDVLIIDDSSNFFGQESLGLGKIRGNSVLLLTEEELFFGMWKPKKEILIPVKSIIKIKNPKSDRYRSVLRPLLDEIFTNEKRVKDSIVWYVRDLEKWNEVLGKLIK